MAVIQLFHSYTRCLCIQNYVGFVQKTPNPNDGRSTLLTLTDKGKDKFELLMPKMQASGQHYRQALSEGEAILLLELIEKLQKHAELLLNQEG